MKSKHESAAVGMGRSMARRLTGGTKNRTRTSAPPKDLALAIGDSWFRYWPRGDVLDFLEEKETLGLTIARSAREGQKLCEMLYKDYASLKEDPPQDGLVSGEQIVWLLDKIRHLGKDAERVAVIMISGGGNDVAGDGCVMSLLVKSAAELGDGRAGANQGASRINGHQFKALVDGRLRELYEILLGCIDETWRQSAPDVPRPCILLHGYSYPVPDGRGALGNVWLKPAFDDLGYTSLAETTAIMKELIDRLNAMQIAMADECGLPDVRHVNVRPALQNRLDGDAYKAFWQNELHPTIPTGFAKVADVFEQELLKLK